MSLGEIHPTVKAMQDRALVCQTLMGGTKAMREAWKLYLPQEDAESDKAYLSRLRKSVLYPAFSKTVNGFVGKPFSKPIQLGDDVPSQMKDWLENCDLLGRDFDTFAREVFRRVLVDGFGFILVDYPMVTTPLSLADEQAMGVRPYFVHVPLNNILGWRLSYSGGLPVIDQLRIKEQVEEPSGAYGVKIVDQIRVLTPGHVDVFRSAGDPRTGASDWSLVPEMSGDTTFPGVPVVPVYAGRVGFLEATPPLEDMAWLNVRHWQSSSDQAHILHVARVPILFGAGLDIPGGTEVVVGPNRLIRAPLGAQLSFVEHTGAAIAAGRQDIADMEEQMQRIAGEFLVRKKGVKTATESRLEAMDGASVLKGWVWDYQDALEATLMVMGMWVGMPGGTVEVYTGWDDTDVDSQDLVTVLGAAQSGFVSKDTWLWNLHRKGMLPPGITPEDEAERMAAEPPTGMSTAVPTGVQIPETPQDSTT